MTATRLREIALELAGMVEGINDCHGCLDQRPSERRRFDALWRELAEDEPIVDPNTPDPEPGSTRPL